MDENRLKALRILHTVFFKGMKTKDALHDLLDQKTRDIDRAFIMELVYGCVRNKLYLEWMLNNFIKDPSRTKKETLLNLMIAVYQMLFMRVPYWASVNEAVEIEKFSKGLPSLVNGVLRHFLRKRNNLPFPTFSENPIQYISLKTSHPEWIIKRWIEKFTPEVVLQLAKANNCIPPLTLRVNNLASSVERVSKTLGKRGLSCSLSEYSPHGLILHNAPIQKIADLLGQVFIQDEASQIISYFVDPGENETVLDACAAPGGKSTHLAQITLNKTNIIAVEKDKERMKKLLENIEKLQTSCVQPLEKDIMKFKADMLFDKILLDAPCSAFGVIRRNPDVKYRYSSEKLEQLGKKQLDMLLHVSDFLKRKGVLIYSVCTTETEETVNVVKDFLNIKKNFYIIDNIDDIHLHENFKSKVKRLLTNEGYLITYPHMHNMDSFFSVRLSRK